LIQLIKLKMMKNLILVVFCVTLAYNTQARTEKTVGEFSELKVYDLIEVKLIKSSENKISITGKNANDVVVINKNGTLKIRMNLEESFDGSKTYATLYYTKIDVIDVNEGAYVYSDDNIKQFDLKLKAQEGGLIKCHFETSFVDIKSVTGGIIEAEGVTKKQKVTLNTGGIYKGENLKTEETEVSVVAAGEAHVNASKLVDLKIRVGGDVYIYGNPEKINESKAIGGRVKLVN